MSALLGTPLGLFPRNFPPGTSTWVDIWWDKGASPLTRHDVNKSSHMPTGRRIRPCRKFVADKNKTMDKTSTVASSNWEREELTTAQVEYGAMDVWVALRMYQRLHTVYMNAEKEEKEEADLE